MKNKKHLDFNLLKYEYEFETHDFVKKYKLSNSQELTDNKVH